MTDSAPSFDALLAPVGRARFMADYWGKTFLHIRGTKGRFAHYLNWDELSDMLEWHSPPPDLKLFHDGNPVERSHYIDNFAKPPEYWQINAGRLITSLSQGCSMVIDAIQKNRAAIRDLSEEFERVFLAPNLVNLYAGWGTQNGFKLHWDAQEVFVLQVSGRKHWQIFAPTRPHPLQDDAEKPPQPQGAPIFDGMVEDGDLLYMPRGFWHVVRPVGEPSLHLNVGLEMATGVDFLRWWLPRLIRHAEVRADLPLLESGGGRDYLSRILQVMSRDAQAQDLAGNFLNEWNAFRRVRPRLNLPAAPDQQKAPLEMTTLVRLAQRSGLFVEQKPGDRTAKFQAVGGTYEVSPQIAPVMAKLSGHKPITVAELCAGLTDPRLVKDVFTALEILANSGVILKQDPAGR